MRTGRFATGTSSPTAARCGSISRARSAAAVVHPAMEITYAGKPQMISGDHVESSEPIPQRGAAVLLRLWGALQGSGCLVHFALDGDRWSVKPNFFMQPWTLMAPSQMARFPAAAFLYRRGLVKPGDVLAN